MRPLHLFSLFCLLLMLGVFFTPAAFCQRNGAGEDVHASLVPGKKKSFIAYAGSDHSFTMEVPFKTSKPSDIPGFVNVDGQIVQATLLPAQDVASKRAQVQAADVKHDQGKTAGTKDDEVQTAGALTPARQQELLTSYMNYELGYYRKKLKQKYTNLQTDWVTIQDRLFLVWYFDIPKDNRLVSRQLYFSTIFSGQILDLNAPVFKTDGFGKAKGILTKMVNSLKTYERRIDVAKLEGGGKK